MSDQFDVSLEDPDLLGEVEMTTNLIIAASEAAGPLDQEEIDAILGVAPVAATEAARGEDDPAE
jgi:hypothetical protein